MSRGRRQERGAALVEFAASLVLLLLLLLGLLEFGLLFKDLLVLHEVARVGARSAAVGALTTTVTERAVNSAVSLNRASVQVRLRCSTDHGTTFPLTVGNTETQNDAPVGSLVKASVSYPHRYVTGFVVPGQQTRLLVAEMVNQREYASGDIATGGVPPGKGKGKGKGATGGGNPGKGGGKGAAPVLPIDPPLPPP